MESDEVETPFGIIDEQTVKAIEKWRHEAVQEVMDEVPPLRAREIADFVAEGGRVSSFYRSRRQPMGPWMLLALDAVIERDFEVSAVERYAEPPSSAHIPPVTQSVPVSASENKTVLFQATRFVTEKKSGRKWAITTDEDPYCGAYYFIFETAEDDEEVKMQAIWKSMHKWLVNESPIKGGALRANGSFMSVDNISLDDVVLADAVRKGITKNICTFLKNIETFTKNGNKNSRGVLLAGPPGCGKTLTSRALVNHRGDATSIYVTSDDIREPGDLTGIYSMARMLSPTLVIIEDLDCLGGAGMDRKQRSGHPLLGEFLEVLCGSTTNSQVVTVASTNHPNLLDEALINRPGRIDAIIPVSPPDAHGRRLILRMEMKQHEVEEGIDIGTLAKKTEGFTGSHLVGLVNNAELEAMHRLDCDSKDDVKVVITQEDFDAALAEIKETRERAGGSIMEEIRPSDESSFAELYS